MADIISGPLAEPKDRRGLLRPEYSLDGGLSWQPWTGSQSIGDLAVGERVTVLLRGVVDPLTTGILTNVAQVSSPTPDPNPDNNTATVETPVTEQADLSVVKVGAPKPAAVGDLVTYTLAVANAGPVNAENTVLSDPLPDALASPEVSLDGGRSFQPWAGTLALGTLLPGQAQTILLRGTVRASADALLINTATVQSDTPDPNPDNNTDTEELPVQLAADLAITKLGSPSPVSAGGLLTYTLDLTNLGPAYAQNVSLTDPLPPPLSDGAYSLDNGGTWQPWTGSLALGTLPAGDHRQILLRGTVAQGTSGTLTNTATVASAHPGGHRCGPGSNQIWGTQSGAPRAGLGLHPFPDQSGPRSRGPSGAHRSPVAPSAGTGVLHKRRGNLATLGRNMAARQPGPRPACRAPLAGHSQPGGRGDSGQHCCCHQRHPRPQSGQQ